MTREMIHNELMSKVENYNDVYKACVKYQNEFNEICETGERALEELSKIIQHLSELEEMYS